MTQTQHKAAPLWSSDTRIEVLRQTELIPPKTLTKIPHLYSSTLVRNKVRNHPLLWYDTQFTSQNEIKPNLSYFQDRLLLFPKPGARSWTENPRKDADKAEAGESFSSHFLCVCPVEHWSPFSVCFCQCPLAVSDSPGSSSCSAAPVGFTFPLLRPPDAALSLVPARAESAKTNLCGLPPFLSLPPCSDSSPLADLRLSPNHMQMARLESERKSERGEREREEERQTERQMSNRGASVSGAGGRLEADTAPIQKSRISPLGGRVRSSVSSPSPIAGPWHPFTLGSTDCTPPSALPLPSVWPRWAEGL